jgi:hypothetical protein
MYGTSRMEELLRHIDLDRGLRIADFNSWAVELIDWGR